MTQEIIVGGIDWLRNDYACSITIGGVTYPSVEHAYQGSKFTDKSVQRDIADADSLREARRIGREAGGLRSNWDDIKLSVMETLLRQKFITDPILADRLAKTGSSPIVMKGYDSFWGTGNGKNGDNALGTVLEKVRQEIQFVNGIDPSDFDVPEDDETEDEKPTLKDAILNSADADLANACQALFVGSIALTSLVDANDFDAGFISRRTGVSMEHAEAAVQTLREWQSAINTLKDLLVEESEDDWLPSNIDD